MQVFIFAGGKIEEKLPKIKFNLFILVKVSTWDRINNKQSISKKEGHPILVKVPAIYINRRVVVSFGNKKFFLPKSDDFKIVIFPQNSIRGLDFNKGRFSNNKNIAVILDLGDVVRIWTEEKDTKYSLITHNTVNRSIMVKTYP